MYPRNAASPEPIAIGPVVQISDGAVQTAGVTVRIKPIGVAEGDGAGTTAYSTDGIVLYTPTQAETNYSSFVLIAKKASCIPANITIVTTESATAGRVSLGNILGTAVTEGAAGRVAGGFVKWFNVASPTGTVNSVPDAPPDAVGGIRDVARINGVVTTSVTTIKPVLGLAVDGVITTLTNLPAITANWLTAAGIASDAFTAAKFAAASLNGKGDWNIGKTGYSLTQAFPTNFAAMGISVGGVVNADAVAISGDSIAADNAEAFFDGTGYAGTNNVIPTVTTLTNKSGFALTATGLDLVTAWTVNVTGNITGNLSGSVGSVTTKTGYELASTGLNAIVPTEPAAVPSWGTSTIVQWLSWLGAWSRNKVTSTSTTTTLRNDADNANIATMTHSDDTVIFTSGEAS